MALYDRGNTTLNIQHIQPLNINIDCNKIKDKKQKLLGVYIDEILCWTEHIDHLCAIIASKI